MDAGRREVFGRTVEVSHPDKVFFDEAALTKGDLLAYHERIAATMLPHVVGHPVATKRYPDGIAGDGFFQKQAPDHFPDWVRRVDVPLRGGGDDVPHVVVEEEATLLELVQFGVVELHPWLSPADDLERPDRLIVDLDPEEGDVDGARDAARAVRDVLREVGVEPLLMTSGSAGYHVAVFVDPDLYFDEVRRFARDVAGVVVDRHPDATTIEHRIEDRGGRVFLDYLRNAYGQTSIAPYGVRALPTAPVATPIDWDELGTTDPRRWTVANLFRRLGQRRDPWADRGRTDLRAARRRLDDLVGLSD